MEFLRKIEANPNTKVLAWWYEITQQELEKIKENSVFSITPQFSGDAKDSFRTFWHDDFHLMEYENRDKHFVIFFSKSKPFEEIVQRFKF